MSFKLGDVIIDRLQFGYGAKSNGTPLYVLTQLSDASISISAESQDITDKEGNLVYRKYTGKKGDVTATNAFMNLAVVEALSATDAEIATIEHGIVMPMFKIVKSSETLDITDYVDGSVVVNALSANGSMGKEYKLGSTASATEFSIASVDADEDTGMVAGAVLTPPSDADEVQYVVKFKKTVYNGTKITNSADNFPKSHELFFKALAVDPCNKEVLKACIIEIPSFMPSPDMELNIAGGDSQTLNYTGAMMLDYCSVDKTLFNLYFIDEDEEV